MNHTAVSWLHLIIVVHNDVNESGDNIVIGKRHVKMIAFEELQLMKIQKKVVSRLRETDLKDSEFLCLGLLCPLNLL